MARATKKKTRKTEATEADAKSGVHYSHDENGPVVTEAIPAEELNALGVQLADLEGKHEELEAEAKEHGKEFRKMLRESSARIRRLARQMRSGVREVPAQQSLPMTSKVAAECAENVVRLEADLRGVSGVLHVNGTTHSSESLAPVAADTVDEPAPF